MIERIPDWKILEGALFHFDQKRPWMVLTFKAADPVLRALLDGRDC